MHRQSLQSHLLNLPRELRDLIYTHLVASPTPISLYGPLIHTLTSPLSSDPVLHSEATEMLYKTNTLILGLRPKPHPHQPNRWGPQPASKRHIRRLVVMCIESESSVSDPVTYEEKYAPSTIERQLWADLLELTKLESLTINMQRSHTLHLRYLDFAPILYHLRSLHPTLTLTFNISFGFLLHQAWGDSFCPDVVTPEGRARDASAEYDTDLTHLFAPPSDEDREHVRRFILRNKMRRGLDVVTELLGERREFRRMLAEYYRVSDPPLVRVLMEEHYGIYLEAERKRKESMTGGVEEAREMASTV